MIIAGCRSSEFRRLVKGIVLLSTLFVVALGTRGPKADWVAKPKPRPRAVVENRIKSCVESLQGYEFAAEPVRSSLSFRPSVLYMDVARESLSSYLTLHGLAPSRAPPA